MSDNKSIIGVTIVTPEYKELSQEAVKRFKKYSGLDVCAVEVDNQQNSYEIKFKLLELFKGKKICFFDSDLFAVRDLNLHKIKFEDVAGVNDPTALSSHSFVRHDCFNLSIPFDRYLNTGFLLMDLSKRTVIKAFEIAIKTDRNSLNMMDKTEQSLLNYAFMQAGCDIKTLPFEYNFFKPAVDWGIYPFIPRSVFNVHAAGYPLHQKKSQLETQCKFFEGDISPLSEYIPLPNINTKQRRGFIVTTEDQLDLTKEARNRVFKYLDISCDIIIAKSRNEAHKLKLSTFLNYRNEEVYLFDNDLWFVDKVKLPKLSNGQVCATRSISSVVEKRAKEIGIDYEKYFCSCFVGAYVDDDFRFLIDHALELRGSALYDEKSFNEAVKDFDYNVIMHEDNINWCGQNTGHIKVKAFHAARRKDKLEWLTSAVRSFSNNNKNSKFKPFVKHEVSGYSSN